MSNQRLKLLNQYNDFIKQVNEEIFYLDQKEQLELNRDWSSPNKLDSFSLKQYKKNLDYDLERRMLTNISPIKHLAQAMINEKHPAANHINVFFTPFFQFLLFFLIFVFQTHTEALLEHFNWINDLSYLLSVHLNHLTDFESVNFLF